MAYLYAPSQMQNSFLVVSSLIDTGAFAAREINQTNVLFPFAQLTFDYFAYGVMDAGFIPMQVAAITLNAGASYINQKFYDIEQSECGVSDLFLVMASYGVGAFMSYKSGLQPKMYMSNITKAVNILNFMYFTHTLSKNFSTVSSHCYKSISTVYGYGFSDVEYGNEQNIEDNKDHLEKLIIGADSVSLVSDTL